VGMSGANPKGQRLQCIPVGVGSDLNHKYYATLKKVLMGLIWPLSVTKKTSFTKLTTAVSALRLLCFNSNPVTK